MQTANKPENNNNSHEAHPSLGKALITPEVVKMWAEGCRQDMHNATRETDQHYHEGQMRAYEYILHVLTTGQYD